MSFCRTQLRRLSVKRSSRFRRSSRIACSAKTATQQLRLTEQIFSKIPQEEETGGAGGRTSYASLKAVDKVWQDLKNNIQLLGPDSPPFVVENELPIEFIDYDVLVCGGTLGIFLACSLQKRGFRVAVLERGVLKGRKQEWNISRTELEALEREGILTTEEIESCLNIAWERVRAGFHNGVEVWTSGILNLGLSPERLIELCRQKFIELGGVVCQRITLKSVELHINGVELILNPTNQEKEVDCRLSGRLLIDCMGHRSPIVQQARQGQRPDGVCLVVGTLSRGFAQNDFSDLIKTNEHILENKMNGNRVQYFWEAFPAGSGPTDRTTYMFTYVDAMPQRPSLEDLFEDYWTLMPKYQNVELDDLEVLRALFGFFPTYKDSPLRSSFDRIIHVGDAGGLQSPLSFGGFGAMLRHLTRHTDAISAALNARIVDQDSLSLINPYNPGLSSTWLFQKAMCAQQSTPSEFINETLSNNFRVMDLLGPEVLTPFLKDVTLFSPLSITLLVQVLTNPGFLVQVTRSLGLATIFEWLPHFLRLGLYQAGTLVVPILNTLADSLPPRDKYKIQRFADALEYGSGSDYYKN